MAKITGLKCRECGRPYPAEPLHVCEFCFGPLEVDYDYGTLQKLVTRKRIEAGPPTMWRYRDLLPVASEEPVIYKVAKEYRLVPNIRRARVTESTGEVLVDFSGAEEDLNRGVTYLTGLGITVKEVRE